MVLQPTGDDLYTHVQKIQKPDNIHSITFHDISQEWRAGLSKTTCIESEDGWLFYRIGKLPPFPISSELTMVHNVILLKHISGFCSADEDELSNAIDSYRTKVPKSVLARCEAAFIKKDSPGNPNKARRAIVQI